MMSNFDSNKKNIQHSSARKILFVLPFTYLG